MSYLTYSINIQESVISMKLDGYKVKDICRKFNISVYTLYKILHINGKMPTPSEASEGKDSEERVEHRQVSPNNNLVQERPTSTWNLKSDYHKKIDHMCLRCNTIFQARDRGNRTKFCSKYCKNMFNTEQNSKINKCDNCGNHFRIKNSLADSRIRCPECRKLNLRSPSSKMSRLLGEWLSSEFNIEKEKQFDWFFDKPKGRFKLDYFLTDFNIGIEYDGEQHFRPSFTGKWETVDKVQRRDKLKDTMCLEQNIKIIRFRYDEKLDKETVLMKIYAELQGIEPVEVEDKKLL
jgi:very-short-patch-repair endonuclease/DNA-directed RNA polymerase subunit RPC12/RpoP